MEKYHRLHRGDKEALHKSVMKVWDEVANEEVFSKVFGRLTKNFAIIKGDGGGNGRVEDFRGEKGKRELAGYDWEGVAAEVGVGGGGAEVDGEEEDGLEAEM